MANELCDSHLQQKQRRDRGSVANMVLFIFGELVQDRMIGQRAPP